MMLKNLYNCLILFCLSAIVSCTGGPADKSETSISKKPNILLILADDWSYPHAGVLGDSVIQTPNFDFLAKNGALFHRAFCAAPSCTPSRAAILTGKYPHELGEGANLWSTLSTQHANYVQLLQNNGYQTGLMWKGWGPGSHEAGGYSDNPAGAKYLDFETFMQQRKPGSPFCFWIGSTDPHRPYAPDMGLLMGMKPNEVQVPDFFPDSLPVKLDILDYYFEVERLDRYVGKIISLLKKTGELDNTLIVITSDNGMPFPRCKANLYDYGTRVPLVIYHRGKISPANITDGFVNLIDLAPTFLEAAGLPIPKEMSGKSLYSYITQQKGQLPESVFLERERHAYVREGNLSYPMRAIRTGQYLYIQNLKPERMPAGDSIKIHAVGSYGDVDESITKDIIMGMKNDGSPYFDLTFGRRPFEELYDVVQDPYQLNNLALQPELKEVKSTLRQALENQMKLTNDGRLSDTGGEMYEKATYYGPGASGEGNIHPRSARQIQN